MREILFRGKTVETNEWIYGAVHAIHEKVFMFDQETWGIGVNGDTLFSAVEVVPETIGQSVGLKYENEERVFEGDLIKIPCTNKELHGNYAIYEVKYQNGTWIAEYLISEKGQVVPRRYMGSILLDNTDYTTKDIINFERDIHLWNIEPYGNIHDQPEFQNK